LFTNLEKERERKRKKTALI